MKLLPSQCPREDKEQAYKSTEDRYAPSHLWPPGRVLDPLPASQEFSFAGVQLLEGSWQEAVEVDLGSLCWTCTNLPHVPAWAAAIRKAGCLWRVEEFPVLHRLRGLEDKMFSLFRGLPVPALPLSPSHGASYRWTGILSGCGRNVQIPACLPSSRWLSALPGHPLSVLLTARFLTWELQQSHSTLWILAAGV